MKRIRRTKEEISLGVTVEQKKAELKKIENREKEVARRLKESNNNKQEIPTGPVAKEVIIINDSKNKTAVQELLAEELGKVNWEWEQVTLDDSFRSARLKSLGDAGWKFAFVYDPGSVKDAWKNKPSVLFFQRPKNGSKIKKEVRKNSDVNGAASGQRKSTRRANASGKTKRS